METSRSNRSIRDAGIAASIAVAIELSIMSEPADIVEETGDSLWQVASRMSASLSNQSNKPGKKWGVKSGWHGVSK
jgi:hypothetical protein